MGIFRKVLFIILAPIYIASAVLLFLTFEWWSDLWAK